MIRPNLITQAGQAIAVPLLVTILFIFGLSACQPEKVFTHQLTLDIVDSLEIEADNVFRLSLTKISDADDNDSILVIFSGNDSEVHYLDTDLNVAQTEAGKIKEMRLYDANQMNSLFESQSEK